MDGCVPDSIRYVPGLRLLHVSVTQPEVAVAEQVTTVPAATGATSVASDRARASCGGGVKPGADPTVDHVTLSVTSPAWLGLASQVVPPAGQAALAVPRPPPIWPTIVSDVGMRFAAGGVTPVGVGGWKYRLFVRLIVSEVPVET